MNEHMDTNTYVERVMSDIYGADTRYVEKPWGFEFIIDAGNFLLKLVQVNDDHRTSLQYHRVKHEVIAIAAGTGYVENHACNCKSRAGDITMNRPAEIHRTVGPVTLIEITTPEDHDVVRVADDYGRGEST